MPPSASHNLRPIPHSESQALRCYEPLMTDINNDPKPLDLFHYGHNSSKAPTRRLLRKNNEQQNLIFISGVCSNEGKPSARAGYSIHWSTQVQLAKRLEGKGPETADRAALRAAIVAISRGNWREERLDKVVLACDSQYLVQNICTNKWKYKKRDHEVNADLWDILSILLHQCDNLGVLIQFWLVEKEDNKADAPAREGALKVKE